jgi:hypothetical protein
MSVIVDITNGPDVTIPYTDRMTAQDALQAAEREVADSTKFLFGLEYYGDSGGQYVGYLVSMVNNTYESFPGSTTGPYAYWAFLVNGQYQNKGIDTTYLSDGDVVTFTLEQYQPTAPTKKNGVLEAKLVRRGLATTS